MLCTGKELSGWAGCQRIDRQSDAAVGTAVDVAPHPPPGEVDHDQEGHDQRHVQGNQQHAVQEVNDPLELSVRDAKQVFYPGQLLRQRLHELLDLVCQLVDQRDGLAAEPCRQLG